MPDIHAITNKSRPPLNLPRQHDFARNLLNSGNYVSE